jgi:folate-dependent phosphoribosylglycinamide formyltransferase PurN
MDLFVLSLFLKESPPWKLMVGVQRGKSLNGNKFSKIWRILKSNGWCFVGFNIFLNIGLMRKLIFEKAGDCLRLKDLAYKYKFKKFYFARVNDESTLATIREFNPDVILNHMPQRLRDPLIRLPRKGVFNIHPGLLPKYQGMGSCLWPLIDGASHHGATLHLIDSEEIDVGPIIYSGRFPIQASDSVLALHIKSRMIAALLACRLIKEIYQAGYLKYKIQLDGNYHKLPGRKDLKMMFDKGHSYFYLKDRRILNENNIIEFQYCDNDTKWEWKSFY